MKLMRVTIDLMVEDLPDEEMQRHGDEADMSLDELPTLEQTDVREIASVLDGGLTPPGPHGIAGEVIREMLFEGTDLFVTFTSAKVVSAEWVDTDQDAQAVPS